MKKLSKLKLSKTDEVLNDDEMKLILGGAELEYTGCSISVNCARGTISCGETTGNCGYIRNDNGLVIGIKCGDKEHKCTD